MCCGSGCACRSALLYPPVAARAPAPATATAVFKQREDLRALAECMLSALALNGPSQLTNAESIQVGAASAARQPSSCLPPALAPPARCPSALAALYRVPTQAQCQPCDPLTFLQRLLGEVFVWGVEDFRWVAGKACSAEHFGRHADMHIQ